MAIQEEWIGDDRMLIFLVPDIRKSYEEYKTPASCSVGDCLTNGGHLLFKEHKNASLRCDHCHHRPDDKYCDCLECKLI